MRWTYVASHVFGYPTRVPPFVTVHQPRYLINKGMMTPLPPTPPPTPARHFSNNNDDDDDDEDDGRNMCVYCTYIYIVYIYGVYDYYYYYHYYKRQEYNIIFQNEISEPKTYYYLLYIILAIYDCRREKRSDAMYLLHIIITYMPYTHVLRHTLRMRRGKRYNNNSCRREIDIRCDVDRQQLWNIILLSVFSDKYFVCVARVVLGAVETL